MKISLLLAAMLVTTPAFAQGPFEENPTPTSAPTPTPTPNATPTTASDPNELPDFPPPTLPAPPRPEPRQTGSVEAGYAYQSLYGIWINGVEASGRLGVDLRSWSVGAEAELVAGRTDGGLGTLAITVGSFAEAHIDRIRFGGGSRIGGFSVDRVTTGGSLGTATIGIFARLSFDLVPFDDEWKGALFLVARGGVDDAGGALYCTSVGVGARF